MRWRPERGRLEERPERAAPPTGYSRRRVELDAEAAVAAAAHRRRRRRVILELVRTGALMACIVTSWLLGLAGRRELVQSQRAGCARSTVDRLENAAAWSDAARARAAEGDYGVAGRYARRAAGFRERAGVPADASLEQIAAECRRRYPDPGLLGL